MPVFVSTQENFNGGEVSPNLRCATQIEKYYTAAERIENYLVTKEGNARYREGLKFVKATKSNNKAFLADFLSTNDEVYLLSFSDSYVTFFRNNTQVAEIASPYKEADLFNIKMVIEKDTIFIVDNNHVPYKLTKTATDTFSLVAIDFEYPPFLPENLTTTTINPSATTGTITLTASTAIFSENDVGRYVKIRSGASTGYAKITVFTTTLLVTAVVVTTLPTAAAVDTWSISPVCSCVAFFQSRLYFGYENTFWGSKLPSDDGTTNYDDFTTGSTAEDAFVFTSSMLSPGLLWMAVNDKSMFGASSKNVFTLSPSDTTIVMGITNPPDINIISTSGSSNVATTIKNNTIFFIDSSGKKLNSLNYSFELEGYQILDNSLLSNKILNSPVTQTAFQDSDNDYAWCVRTDGVLVGLNYLPEQSVNSWFRVKIDGEIESAAVLTNLTGYNKLYVVSKRVVNGSTVRYIEYLDDYKQMPNFLDYFTDDYDDDYSEYSFDTWIEQKNYNNLDSFITYDGSDSTNSPTTMTPAAITGDDVVFTAGAILFSSGDVGREIWEKSNVGRARITEYVSTTQVKCSFLVDFASTSTLAAGNWYFTKNTFTGLSHLEAEEVTVISDGSELSGTYTVASGVVTIVKQASQATIGLKYTGIIKSLPIQGGSANGNSRIKPQKIDRFGICVLDSIGGEIGSNMYNLTEIIFGPAKIYGRAILPFTGIKEISIQDTYEKEKYIYVVQRKSLPLTVQLITSIVETNESN